MDNKTFCHWQQHIMTVTIPNLEREGEGKRVVPEMVRSRAEERTPQQEQWPQIKEASHFQTFINQGINQQYYLLILCSSWLLISCRCFLLMEATSQEITWYNLQRLGFQGMGQSLEGWKVEGKYWIFNTMMTNKKGFSR